jgi:hypothetical protein
VIKRTTVWFGVFSLAAALLAGDPAGEDAAAFLKIKPGARAIGMGGAYVTAADDPSAVYWNPAGLAFSGERVQMCGTVIHDQIEGGNGFEAGGNQFFAVSCTPGLKLFEKPVSFGLGIRRMGVDDIEYRPQRNMTGGTFGFNESALYVSGAARLLDNLALGMALNFVSSGFEGLSAGGASGKGVGFSYGMRIDLTDRLTLGLNVSNGFKIKWKYASTDVEKDRVPYKGRAGASYRPAKGVLLAMDGEGIKGWPLAFHLGSEIDVTRQGLGWLQTDQFDLALRAGLENIVRARYNRQGADFLKDGSFNFGVGLGKRLGKNWSVRLDGAYGMYSMYTLCDRMVWSLNLGYL